MGNLNLPITINDGKVTISPVGGTSDPRVVVLAAYLNLIADGGEKFRNNPLTSAIQDAFGVGSNS
ncbi:MAG: hypothetical protein LBB48_06580 [Treponema sp.]|nr:hypothetical protein [Treponema sp.]